jgi:hypothetical protein
MPDRTFLNQDIYDNGRVRFVGARVHLDNDSLSIEARDGRSYFRQAMVLSPVSLKGTVGTVHTFVGTDEQGRRRTLKMLPNSSRGCGCGKKRSS